MRLCVMIHGAWGWLETLGDLPAIMIEPGRLLARMIRLVLMIRLRLVLGGVREVAILLHKGLKTGIRPPPPPPPPLLLLLLLMMMLLLLLLLLMMLLLLLLLLFLLFFF